MEKAAKQFLLSDDEANATKLLVRATEIAETENRPLQASYYTTELLRLDLGKDRPLTENAVLKCEKLVQFYQVIKQ